PPSPTRLGAGPSSRRRARPSRGASCRESPPEGEATHLGPRSGGHRTRPTRTARSRVLRRVRLLAHHARPDDPRQSRGLGPDRAGPVRLHRPEADPGGTAPGPLFLLPGLREIFGPGGPAVAPTDVQGSSEPRPDVARGTQLRG